MNHSKQDRHNIAWVAAITLVVLVSDLTVAATGPQDLWDWATYVLSVVALVAGGRTLWLVLRLGPDHPVSLASEYALALTLALTHFVITASNPTAKNLLFSLVWVLVLVVGGRGHGRRHFTRLIGDKSRALLAKLTTAEPAAAPAPSR